MLLWERVAIVGMAVRFPGAGSDLARFWTQVASRQDCAREVPAGRWTLPPEHIVRDGLHADAVPTSRGYYLDPFEPDLAGLDIDPKLVAELDPLFHLVLDVGARAFRTASTAAINRNRAGVILGNICLPTEKANDLAREVFSLRSGTRLSVHPFNRHPTGLPAMLLAKSLGFSGTAFTLDAACASTLYAVKLAADELLAGRADLMLAGGASRPDCLYTQLGFAQLRALSPRGVCSPFSAAANGLVVGEGAGVFVLKRLSDARRDGDRIHAVLVGAGLSNDQNGNLLSPAKEGQLRAMRAAYRRAGWKPSDVDLIECHATGTPVGDAVEFESLRELWQGETFVPGQCVIGSVKSTVGHLLTGAGAAAIAKVILAMEHRQRPPQANFQEPNPAIDFQSSPFRVMTITEPWTPQNGAPRRAAVSGFGFGGINAHLLLEEWQPADRTDSSRLTSVVEPPESIAIVGLAAHVGPWSTIREVQERVLSGGIDHPTRPRDSGESVGHFLDEVRVPLDRFRIPPTEVEAMLPQQILMLKTAAAALDNCRGTSNADVALRTGAFIGLGLDFNATNFHLRWSGSADCPPLTADRVMGALGSIAASRIARTFAFGGPSFTICSEETSAGRAIELAVRALRHGELDRALAGGVELPGDLRALHASDELTPALRADGAVAIVLKRLADAERDGDRVYAVITDLEGTIDGSTLSIDATQSPLGHTGFACAALGVATAALALFHQILPPSPHRSSPQYWLADRADLPRRAIVMSVGLAGTSFRCTLQEHVSKSDYDADCAQPLGARDEAIFAVTGDSPVELFDQLTRLNGWIPTSSRNIEALARDWHAVHPIDSRHLLAVTFVTRGTIELRELVAIAQSHLESNSGRPLPDPSRPGEDRIFYCPVPLGRGGKLAYVFPGSGNQFAGMGRELGVQWPQILRHQQRESERLRTQFSPQFFWSDDLPADAGPRDYLFGQVTFGTLAADLLGSLGVKPDAMIGISLGESAGLFGLRIWTARDEMHRRLRAGTLFTTDLGPPYNAARSQYRLASDAPFHWTIGLVAADASKVKLHLRRGRHAYLLIITGPNECVIGGEANDVAILTSALGQPLLPITGVTLAHCEAGLPVVESYRNLHTLPVTSRSVTVYSGAWAKPYEPTTYNCADSITAGLLNTIDVPRLIETAYADGMRAFVEVGPGGSTARMIDAILGDRPHLARTISAPRQNAVSQVLKLQAHLISERFPVSLDGLYGGESFCVAHRRIESTGREIVVPTGLAVRVKALQGPTVQSVADLIAPADPVAMPLHPDLPKVIATTTTAAAEAHARFLAVQDAFTQTARAAMQLQMQLMHRLHCQLPPPSSSPPRSLSLEQCRAFAIGRVGDVLGPLYAEADAFPTRVRLPDGPLMLVDRILAIEGEPKSLTSGRVVTDHTVHGDRWYLDAGRCPTSVTVEAGQADLFLSGFLGIDFATRGLAVYRLLDAVVTFHRGLPKVGERIEYDIRIDGFFRQADAWLFRFRFEGNIDGQPMLSMADGVAGFFNQAALDAGQGIIHTKLDLQPQPGKNLDFAPLVPVEKCSLDAEQVEALRHGDYIAAFGLDFEPTRRMNQPMPLPGGMLRLVDRVPMLDPSGGRFGLGFIRAEYDIRPREWFIECHFVDDKVMPGTLMYECCLQTLRILLHRLGWVAEAGTVCEPVPGIASRLKCRGQVLETTKTVTYEVSVKEIGYRPEAYAIADALMYADGKPIVEITSMSLQFAEKIKESFSAFGVRHTDVPEATDPSVTVLTENRIPNTEHRVYDSASILAFSNGKPSEAFGGEYKAFDRDRVIARLPGPPYQFLDRVIDVKGIPFEMKAGAACVAEYAVPQDAWYFAANRCANMPFSVLLEIALQPCGWLAAYCGSALTSPIDLSFRNLGGQATQFRAVTPEIGTLTTNVTMTKVSSSAGMIIQHYDMKVSCPQGPVYEGTTYFGFFAKEALTNQVGMPGAPVPFLTDEQKALADTGTLPHDSPFPDAMLRMVDRIDGWLPHGGKAGLGLVQGRIAVDPGFWFFKAHFFQDPVWPGSLGLESFLQLLKYVAWRKWGVPAKPWRTVALDAPHEWTYRGQVLPTDREVTVVLEITAEDRAARQLTADGFLIVDGRIIYQMKNFTLE